MISPARKLTLIGSSTHVISKCIQLHFCTPKLTHLISVDDVVLYPCTFIMVKEDTIMVYNIAYVPYEP